MFRMFDIFSFIFPIMFILVFGLVIFVFASTLARSAKQHKKDDASPRLTVDAEVIAKRPHFRRNGDIGHTYYFVTFAVESGDRFELRVPDNEYGLLIEGDRGRLTFQGSRYLGFERR